MARKAIPVILLTALVIIMISAIPASAQRGFQRGFVFDETGTPMPNIKVTLDWVKEQRYDSKGNEHQETTTDAEGKFTFAKLNPGFYTVAISTQGYAPFQQQVEVKTIARNKDLNINLKKVTIENAGGDARAEGEATLAEAQKLVDAGDIEGAVKVYKDFYAKYPDNHLILVQIGEIYEKAGQKDKAIESYLDCLDADAENKAAIMKLGMLYAKDQDSEAAFPYYEQLVGFYPNDKGILFTAGQLANAVGNYPKCFEYYKAYIALDPASATTIQAMMEAGFAASLSDNPAGVVEMFEGLLKLQPEHPYAGEFKKEIEKAKAKMK